MAHILRKSITDESNAVEWDFVQLTEPRVVLNPARCAFGSITLARSVASEWLVLGNAGVRVNGSALLVGARALRNRDEIRFTDGSLLYFSTEVAPCVESFPGDSSRCARCQSDIASQQPAVRCPQCSLWHHQDPIAELPCWTFRERCANCSQPSTLDAGLRWSPELL